ncbi:hypothetical protein [Pseudoclavibacter helvolus]|uniref:hypothetical protein n=1 Tax=Pseudoclavibacter helvolus TaxID=255205 RepID=UPI003C724368
MSLRQTLNSNTSLRAFLALAVACGALALTACQAPAAPAGTPDATETVVITETAPPNATEGADAADTEPDATDATEPTDSGTDSPSGSDADVFDPDGSIGGATSAAESFFTAVDAGDWATVGDRSGDPELVARIQNNSDIRDALTQYAGSPVTCVHRDDDRIQQTLSDAFTVIDDTYACTRVDVEPLDARFWAFPTLFISADPAGENMIVSRTITYWD